MQSAQHALSRRAILRGAASAAMLSFIDLLPQPADADARWIASEHPAFSLGMSAGRPNLHNGPFGAKGVGESSMFCISPAIANALDDAVGVRLTELPLSPEAILRALKANAGSPLEDN